MSDWSADIRARLAHLALAPERESDIVDELSEHLDQLVRDLRARGLSDRDARARALDELADGGALARALRAVERPADPNPPVIGAGEKRDRALLANLWQDVRYAARGFRQRPGFGIVAVLTLALGIGANTTLFGVVNALLLRPLPFPRSEELITFFGSAPEKGLPEVDYPEGLFLVYHDQSRTTQAMAAYSGGGITLTGFGDPQRLDIGVVSTDFFTVLGTRPLLGRTLRADDAKTDSTTVTVLSHAFWQRQLGGDSAVIGRAITLGGSPVEIIGVMPSGFEFPGRAQLWIPLRLRATSFNCWCYSTVARLRPGVTADDVRADILRITDAFASTRPDVFPQYRSGSARVIVMSLLQRTVGDVKRPLLVVLVAGALVLLIACANIANLLLARASVRDRELALRCCLGASRGRIAAQLLTESLVLALVGAATGTLLSVWGIGALRRLPADRLPRIEELTVDPRVLAFGVALGLLTGLLFGVAPAIRASRVNLQHGLNVGTRGSAGQGSRRLSNAFVVSQIAVSLVLLVGAGLTLKSFRNLLDLNPGYRVENVLLARLPIPWPKYRSDTVVRTFAGRLLERVASIPGVQSVGIASRAPLSPGNMQDNVVAEGKEPGPNEPVLVANIRNVTTGYFPAVGTPILAGRNFTEGDVAGAPPVAIVDESFARHFWPGENPIGKRFKHGGDTSSTRWMTVVGIVPNIKHSALDERPSLQVYEPFSQRTTWNDYLVVRSALPAEGLTRTLRAIVTALDPAIPLYDVRTMEEALDRTLGMRRLTDALLSAFAAAALLLAAIGIYGVISINVTARVREFGVRLALGAQPRSVLAMVVRQGATLAAAGIVAGLLSAVWLTGYLDKLLFGVGRLDVPVYSLVALVLGSVGVTACIGPAWRATRADVVSVLKAE